MDYKKQMRWLDYQIQELEAVYKEQGSEFYSTDDYYHLQALMSIRSGYQEVMERLIELGWKEYPDRMGGRF